MATFCKTSKGGFNLEQVTDWLFDPNVPDLYIYLTGGNKYDANEHYLINNEATRALAIIESVCIFDATKDKERHEQPDARVGYASRANIYPYSNEVIWDDTADIIAAHAPDSEYLAQAVERAIENLSRAALVQDHSVHIIKELVKMQAENLAMWLEAYRAAHPARPQPCPVCGRMDINRLFDKKHTKENA